MNKKTKLVFAVALISLVTIATSCTAMLIGLNLSGSTYKDSTGSVTLYFSGNASSSEALYPLEVTVSGVSLTLYWIMNEEAEVEIYTDENGKNIVGTLVPNGVSAKTLTGTVDFGAVSAEWVFTKQ